LALMISLYFSITLYSSSLRALKSDIYEVLSRTCSMVSMPEIAHMSMTSFHQHFKAVTSMSPLQYQKTLRLQEARRLMLSKMLDAGDACQLVGYASASQFSREYSRFFGAAPTKDVVRLRDRLRISGEQQGAS